MDGRLSVANPYRLEDPMTTTTTATTWKLPDLDTVYRLEDHEPITLGQMLDGVDPDLIPTD